MAEPADMQGLVKGLLAEASLKDQRALVQALLAGHPPGLFDQLRTDQKPTLIPLPDDVRGFRVRLELSGSRPSVWRRLELPGDLVLPRVHDVIQAAMGWTDSHLHRFRTGKDYRSPHIVTQFDLDEGEEGLLEDDIRLHQLVADAGDELWYEYDFGDGWEHSLRVEAVLNEPPATVRCTAGRMACPPEDCGGLGGYEELAAWVRSGYDDALLPGVFEDAAQARGWLPVDWNPDHIDLKEINTALAAAATTRRHCGSTSSGGSPSAPATPIARPVGWPSPSLEAAYRRRSGHPRSANCCSRSAGAADRAWTHCRRRTARHVRSSSSWPV